MSFSKDKGRKLQEDYLTIETGERHRYTKEFSDLVRDFYLYVD